MTNRDMLNKLSNMELSFVFYECVQQIGRRYTETIGGVGDWLGEEADVAMWDMWHERFLRSKRA